MQIWKAKKPINAFLASGNILAQTYLNNLQHENTQLGRNLLALSSPMIKNLAPKRTSAERCRWKQWKQWQHNAPFLFEVLPEWPLIWMWGRGDVGCCLNLTQALSNTIVASAYMWWLTRRQAWLLQAQLASRHIHRIQLLHFHNHFLINLNVPHIVLGDSTPPLQHTHTHTYTPPHTHPHLSN